MSKAPLLGVYIHIPYCLQRCTYCDFATYVHTEIRPPTDYVSLLKKEISYKKNLFTTRQLETIYFGGGTPSLIDANLLVDVIQHLKSEGFQTGPNTEITIEINPATVDERKLEIYLKAGVNRFSVGAQTFNDRLLKMVKREHNSKQTLETLQLLRRYNLNFSFDVLFALPTQTVDELKNDVRIAIELGSAHVSPYCLTVPEGHPLSKGRPLEDDQIEMFNAIDDGLVSQGFNRYEISNYARPGFESKHNLLYWTDQEYWGVGLSAHSYSLASSWGQRFWNASNLDIYAQELSEDLANGLGQIRHFESLKKHEALTDYCHTSLRLMKGLVWADLEKKFNSELRITVQKLAASQIEHGFLQQDQFGVQLSPKGLLVSNRIFETFTFLENDIGTH